MEFVTISELAKGFNRSDKAVKYLFKKMVKAGKLHEGSDFVKEESKGGWTYKVSPARFIAEVESATDYKKDEQWSYVSAQEKEGVNLEDRHTNSENDKGQNSSDNFTGKFSPDTDLETQNLKHTLALSQKDAEHFEELSKRSDSELKRINEENKRLHEELKLTKQNEINLQRQVFLLAVGTKDRDTNSDNVSTQNGDTGIHDVPIDEDYVPKSDTSSTQEGINFENEGIQNEKDE
jgi:hypothetical protein